MLKKKLWAAVIFILISVSLLTFSACSKEFLTAEVTVSYLTEEDYLSGDVDGKLKESLEVAIGQKAYAVIDVKLSDLKNADESVNGELYVDFSGLDFNVEEIPTTDYLILGNGDIKATFKLHDGKKNENSLRFIFSVVKDREGAGEIYARVTNSGNLGMRGNYSVRTSTFTASGEAAVKSKLEFMLSADGTYYTVIGLGEEHGEKITVPDAHDGIPVKEIAEHVFSNVGYLKEVILPSGLTKIGLGAFENCTLISSIDIPSSVTEIGSRAFKGCSSIAEIKLPLSVTVIGDSAFAECSPEIHLCCEAKEKPGGWSESSISGITLVTWNCNKNFVFALNDDGETYYFKSASAASGNVEIPELYRGLPVTKIGYSAFGGCTKVTGITVPDSILNIEEKAFSGCTALTGIVLPNGIKVIERYTFENCTKLTEIILPDGVTEIGEGAFYRCESLTEIEIPSTVKAFGDYTFFACTGLAEVLIPEGITEIKKAAFYECKSLSAVEIPSSVKTIGESAFEGCSGLTGITVPGNVSTIEKNAFASCSGATSITIENGVKTIGEKAFSKCTHITEINIPDSVTSLEAAVFSGCEWLEKAVVGNGVTIITSAFQSCEKLNTVSLGTGVTRIAARAFSGCPVLTYVNLMGKTWYRTESSKYTGGYEVTASYNSTKNAELLRSTYMSWYWYKK